MRSRLQVTSWVLLGCFLFLASIPLRSETEQSSVNSDLVNTVKLGALRDSTRLMVYSRDGRHMACVIRGGPGEADKERVCIDAVPESRSYSRIKEIYFSPAGNLVGYCAGTDGGNAVVVVNGKEGPEVDRVEGFTTSPDGTRAAYRALRTIDEPSGEFVVVDGVAGRVYKDVSWPIFSPDGKHIGYWAERDSMTFIVKDNIEAPCRNPSIQRAVLSPALDRVCGTEWGVEPADRVLWVDSTNCGTYAMLDLSRNGAENIVWSSDGSRVGCVMRTKDGDVFIIDCHEVGQYPWASKPEFSPDGQHWAYVVGATNHNRIAVIFDTGKRGPYDNVVAVGDSRSFYEKASGWALRESYVVFSANGDHTAYIASKKGVGRFVVRDGVNQAPYSNIWDVNLSYDGRRLAYAALKPDSTHVITTDSIESPRYEWVGRPVFSPDGTHVAYIARREEVSRHVVVVDGVEKTDWDEPCRPFLPNLLSDNTVEYLSIKDDTLYRVTYRIAHY